MALGLESQGAFADLSRQLEETHRAQVGMPLEDEGPEYLRLYELHWQLREQINAIPARTLADLRVKARAAYMAREVSEGFYHVDGPGSWEALSLSLIADLAALPESGK